MQVHLRLRLVIGLPFLLHYLEMLLMTLKISEWLVEIIAFIALIYRVLANNANPALINE